MAIIKLRKQHITFIPFFNLLYLHFFIFYRELTRAIATLKLKLLIIVTALVCMYYQVYGD